MNCFADEGSRLVGRFARSVLFETAEYKVTGPLKKDFSPALWTSLWKDFREDESDDRLHKSGLWVYERWSSLHAHRIYIESIIAPHNPRLLLLKWINEQTARFFREAEERIGTYKEVTAGVLSRAVSQNPVPDESVLILLGDVVPKIVDTYAFSEQIFDYEPHLDKYVYELGCVLLGIMQTEQRWEECRQLGFWVEETEEHSKFFDPNQEYSQSAALAQDRRNNNELGVSSDFLTIWHHARHMLGRRPPIADSVQLKNGTLSCNLRMQQSRPFEATMLRYVTEQGLAKFIPELALPSFGNVKITELLDVYEILASIAKVIRNGKLQMIGPLVRVTDALVPRIKIHDLVQLLQEALGWTQQKSEHAISAFIYKKNSRDGGWSRPLLPAGDKTVNICLSLMATHPSRLVEHWMIRGGTSEGKRGQCHERELRKELTRCIQQNPILQASSYVCPNSVNIETNLGSRDLDLLFRIENVVFIGEAKALSRPMMPWERRNYIDEVFLKAPDQLTLRMAHIANSRTTRQLLADRTMYKGDVCNLRFICAIVSLHPEGSGCSAQNIPIIDWVSLREYLAGNLYQMGWTSENKFSSTEAQIELTLYANAKEAAERLQLYVQMSLRSAARAPLLSNQPVRGSDPVRMSGKHVEYEQWFVRSYNPSELLNAAHSAVQAWKDTCLLHNV